MKLTVPDVARMFDATERTVERWIRDDGLPHERVQGQYRFHRAELIEWATRRNIRMGSAPLSMRSGAASSSFTQALLAGGVHYHVRAENRDDLLQAVVRLLPIQSDSDREFLFEVLRVRESAGTTGIGEGIAIPHVRTPVILDIAEAAICLCFLNQPIDFRAIDGQPVHTVFLIVAPNIRTHLFLLTRLSAVLHDSQFRTALRENSPPETLLAEAARAERALAEEPDDPTQEDVL